MHSKQEDGPVALRVVAALMRQREASLARALQVSSILVTAIAGIALVGLVAGLVLSARPELFAGLGLTLTARDGLGIALTSGAVAIAAALLGRVLSLLHDNVADGNKGAAR